MNILIAYVKSFLHGLRQFFSAELFTGQGHQEITVKIGDGIFYKTVYLGCTCGKMHYRNFDLRYQDIIDEGVKDMIERRNKLRKELNQSFGKQK